MNLSNGPRPSKTAHSFLEGAYRAPRAAQTNLPTFLAFSRGLSVNQPATDPFSRGVARSKAKLGTARSSFVG